MTFHCHNEFPPTGSGRRKAVRGRESRFNLDLVEAGSEVEFRKVAGLRRAVEEDINAGEGV